MTRQHKSILFPEATGEKPSSQQPDCSHSNGKTQEMQSFGVPHGGEILGSLQWALK